MDEKEFYRTMKTYGGIGLALAAYGMLALTFLVGRFVMGWF